MEEVEEELAKEEGAMEEDKIRKEKSNHIKVQSNVTIARSQAIKKLAAGRSRRMNKRVIKSPIL